MYNAQTIIRVLSELLDPFPTWYTKTMNNLLSVKQAAFILKVHPLTIRRYIKEKKLKAVKVGGNVRIAERDLEEFHKDVEPVDAPNNRVFKTKKLIDKQFSSEDPLLRLQGRGASLKLT